MCAELYGGHGTGLASYRFTTVPEGLKIEGLKSLLDSAPALFAMEMRGVRETRNAVVARPNRRQLERPFLWPQASSCSPPF